MFPKGYLELVGIVDSTRYTHGLDEFLNMREGLVGIALSTESADRACHDLAAAGIGVEPVREVTRNMETPTGFCQPRFRVCFLDRAGVPGLPSTAICQHLTPELLRHADWLKHPNGATGIVSITLPVPSLEAATSAYRALFGQDMVSCTPTSSEIRMENGTMIRLVSGRRTEELKLAVESLACVQMWLGDSRVPFLMLPDGGVQVQSEHGCGVITNFVEQ